MSKGLDCGRKIRATDVPVKRRKTRPTRDETNTTLEALIQDKMTDLVSMAGIQFPEKTELEAIDLAIHILEEMKARQGDAPCFLAYA